MDRTQPGSEFDPESENGSDEIEYPYTCEECGRGFLTAAAHNAHQRVHADDLTVAPDGGEVIENETTATQEESFRTTIDTIADANDAFKRVSKILNDLRQEDEPVTVEIEVAEVDPDA